jgi:pimeloyl-ACP methyl ester carboxylesterase
MPRASVNDVVLFYNVVGKGELPLVLVHGSWVSHHDWDLLVTRLSPLFRILIYDRRGHSDSDRPLAQGSLREDAADLAALIAHCGLGPAWVVGNSFGASIALRMADRRPDLVRGLVLHEPPLFSLLNGDPTVASLLQEIHGKLTGVVEQLASGDYDGGARCFVETVALRPGAWDRLPPHLRETMIDNAPTFLDEARDPEQFFFEVERLQNIAQPTLLTLGDQSPSQFRPVVERLAGVMTSASVLRIPEAGHVPHVTHPDAYAEGVQEFVRRHAV